MEPTKIYYTFSCGCILIEDDVPQWSNLPPLTRDRIKKERKSKKRIFNTMKVCPGHGAELISRHRQCNYPGCENLAKSTKKKGVVPLLCDRHAKEKKKEQRRVCKKKKYYLNKTPTASESAAFPPMRLTGCRYYDDCMSDAAHAGKKLKCKGCPRYEFKPLDMSEVQPREWSEQTCYI